MYERRSFHAQKQLECIFKKIYKCVRHRRDRSAEASGALSMPCLSGMQRELQQMHGTHTTFRLREETKEEEGNGY